VSSTVPFIFGVIWAGVVIFGALTDDDDRQLPPLDALLRAAYAKPAGIICSLVVLAVVL
jgi:hypothetical protein